MVASHQHVSSPPASQLPALALRSPHHPRGPPTPELPDTHTAALTQADHAGAVDIGFTQSAEHRDGSVRVHECTCTETHTFVLHQTSSHLPDQALGGYSRVARTDLLLRGLTATKENKAVFFPSSSFSSSENISSFALASFSSSSSSRELSN